MSNLTMTTVESEFVASPIASYGACMSDGYGTLGEKYMTDKTFTIEFFIESGAVSAVQSIISVWSTFGITLQADGTVRADLGVQSSISVDDGVVHHIAYTASNAGAKLFIDGVLASSSTTSSNSLNIDTSNEIWYVKKDRFQRNFEGKLFGLAFWDSVKYTSDFTVPTSPYTGLEVGLIGLYNLNGNGVDQAGSDNIILYPSATEIYYSPYNWTQEVYISKSICGGSYFKFKADAELIKLNFELPSRDQLPIIKVFRDGELVFKGVISKDLDISPPNEGDRGFLHLYEVVTDAVTSDDDRWLGQDTSIKLAAISLSQGGSLIETSIKPNKVIVYGDSITEGVETVYESITGKSYSGNSATGAYPLEVSKRINSEVGIVGFSGMGFTVDGRGGEPMFPDSYDFIMDGYPRNFTPEPDLCVWMMGTNDLSSDIVPNGLIALNGQLAAMPNTKFLVLRPFRNDVQESNLKSIISQCNDPTRVFFGDTEGFYSTGRVHPYAYEHLTGIATGVANLAQGFVPTNYTGETSSATIAIDGIPDGSYRTVITSEDSRLVFDGDLTYSSGSAVATTIQAPTGINLLGAIIDNANPHVSGAVVSVVSS